MTKKDFCSMNRRKFLQSSALMAGASLWRGDLPLLAADSESRFPAESIRTLADGRLQCSLCPNACVPAEGENGLCRARGLRDGKYVSLVYGLPCVIAIDPVEKMPLFHYHVNSPAMAISTAGCNLTCQYCQNWQFSQKSPAETTNFSFRPEELIVRALDFQVQSIGFFYTEPIIYIEFMKDIARLARKSNLKTIMVTGGYISPEPLRELFELIDMFVVGFKGFNDEFYKEVIGGGIEHVQNTLKLIKGSGRHMEVVSLLIPGKNDSEEQLKTGIDWFIANLGTDVPWHFSRFAPEFKLKNLPPTPNTILEKARKMALAAGMKFVYTGNNPGQEGNHTYCPGCGKKVVERLGFKVMRSVLSRGKCPDCGLQMPGVWLDDLPNGNI
ncbi:MAG TPA: AmmeMemoRadiSam system radical SAM enzyme [Candidatus Rifleibacterium sp.]|nr:AmmeMemoRadiSam system radical SAM enzyme [Candidatus Rifleibacterium sp.]